MAVMDEQLDPGYETGEVPRRPDSPLDAPWRPSYMQPVAPTPPSVVRAQPTRPAPPAEMREYRPTTRERDVARAQSALEGLGVERAGARRIAQTVLGGPQSNLPLGAGLIDVPLLPALPYFMEEGYRSTERAAGAFERGDYGTAALEYLGAVAQTAPGAFAAREVAPGVAKALKSAGVALGESMAANAVTSPMARGQRGTFLPETFFTPQEKANISIAQELEAKGTSPDDVLVQTGLVRDLDGSWAVEISDDKMKFKALEAVKAAREPIVQRINDIEVAMQVRDILDRGGSMGNAARTIRVQTGQDPSPKALTLAQQRTNEQLEAALENANNSLTAPIKGLKYADVIEHPELFQRIPELAEMQVDFVTQADLGGKRTAGHFDPSAPGMGVIRARAQYLRPGEDYGRSLFTHETQHAIDYMSGKDYGISPDTIKEASDYWKAQEPAIRMNYNAENTALYARELMEKSPGMTAEQALDKTLADAWHYGESKDYAKPGVTINPENGMPYTDEGPLRSATINIIENVPADQIQRRAEEAAQRLRENQLKRHTADPTEAGRYEQYMSNVGEARARLTETRLDLTPEERRDIFPMREGMMALDRPPEALKTIGELTGGRYGTKRVAAPAASMGPERSLREVLEDEPYTLRTLENLPGKRTMIPMSEIREQMRRPEVTKAEKDVLERVLARTEGDSISAENLVREVGLETKDFTLAPKDTDRFADYGLQNVNRGTTPEELADWSSQPAQNARTTIHRSPTPTATNNHFGDPNYFGHTRAFEDSQGIPHVVEIQSDLVQKAGKELTLEERTRLENAFDSVIAQEVVVNPIRQRYPYTFQNEDITWASTAAKDIISKQEQLLQANPDFVMLLENGISSRLSTELRNALNIDVRFGNEGDLLRYIASMPNTVSRGVGGLPRPPNEQHLALSVALHEELRDISNTLSLLGSEHSAKLAEGGAATAQRPMFKNWERRLIREELSRAATPQLNPEYESLRNRAKSALKYAKQIEDSYVEQGFSRTDRMIAAATAPFRKEAEDFAQRALEVEQYKPVPPVVRFADADTVALIESWPRRIEVTPGEVMAPELAGKRLMGSRAGTANDWTYTGNVRVDESGIWAAERYPIDVTGNQIGESLWSTTGTSNLSEETINKLTRVSDKFEYPEHQGIYDRYKKEVANYLKSLGGRQVKDDKGHSWWEVPVDPKKAKRTQLFSMGGGAAAVAAGGAATYNSEEQ